MYLGIDIGGSTIKYAHVNADLKVVKEWTIDTFEVTSAKAFYDALVEEMGDLSGIKEIAISAPGVIADDSTVTSIAAAKVAIMFETNVNEEVSKRTNMRVTTVNDAKAAGYAEYSMGAARGTKSSIAYIIGTGIGGSLIYNGEIINGIDGYGGELSRTPIMMADGSIKVGAQLCSASGLIYQYNERANADVKSAREVFDKFHADDPVAIEVMNAWVNYIVIALVQLVSVFNPDVICIGGGVTQDDSLVPRIQAVFDHYSALVFGQPACTTRLVRCEFLTNSNLLGAVLKAHETE
ncbi:ROK family protein [Erysipelothrix sp. HDW6C]|uniref:ROK family protein n=1 Tax=Erysipelothrix sp. HDW6C TaxID=2714930 RepID=UPI00140CAC3F|nr:ROK family protein [Erysipelothrix sp. HDW6C]QIK70555.1 ROK family protein [Erysipelothrix sp. HDW6C]